MPVHPMTDEFARAFVGPAAPIGAPSAHMAARGATGRRPMRTVLIWSGFVLGAAGYVTLLALIISVGLTGAVNA